MPPPLGDRPPFLREPPPDIQGLLQRERAEPPPLQRTYTQTLLGPSYLDSPRDYPPEPEPNVDRADYDVERVRVGLAYADERLRSQNRRPHPRAQKLLMMYKDVCRDLLEMLLKAPPAEGTVNGDEKVRGPEHRGGENGHVGQRGQGAQEGQRALEGQGAQESEAAKEGQAAQEEGRVQGDEASGDRQGQQADRDVNGGQHGDVSDSTAEDECQLLIESMRKLEHEMTRASTNAWPADDVGDTRQMLQEELLKLKLIQFEVRYYMLTEARYGWHVAMEDWGNAGPSTLRSDKLQDAEWKRYWLDIVRRLQAEERYWNKRRRGEPVADMRVIMHLDLEAVCEKIGIDYSRTVRLIKLYVIHSNYNFLADDDAVTAYSLGYWLKLADTLYHDRRELTAIMPVEMRNTEYLTLWAIKVLILDCFDQDDARDWQTWAPSYPAVCVVEQCREERDLDPWRLWSDIDTCKSLGLWRA